MADLDLSSYNGNFSNLRTFGGIPTIDITQAGSSTKIAGRDINVRQADAPWAIIYGKTRVSGVITYVHAQAEFLHLVLTIAGHEIDGIEQLYLDDVAVPIFGAGSNIYGSASGAFSGLVFCSPSLGSPTQVANLDLVSASSLNFPGEWTANSKQSGRAHVYLKLKFSDSVFPNGIPKIEFLVRGRKVYDPRTTLTTYSNNAALCAADFLLNSEFGLGAALSEFDVPALIDAANVCDEAMSLAAGGTEPRYTANGTFNTTQTPAAVLDSFRSAIGFGVIGASQGKWRILPAKWRAPTLSLNDDDIRGQIKVQTKISRRNTCNAVKGTYISPDNNWEAADFPQVKNATYQALDNGELIFADIALPLTTSAATAQRIAKIVLEDTRQQIVVDTTVGLRGFELQPGDNVLITRSRYGWVSKPFRVVEVLPTINSKELVLEVSLRLKETAAGVYDWNSGFETTVDLAPNTTLPDPRTVVTPTNLQLDSGTTRLYQRADGTIFSRIYVSWTAITDPYVVVTGRVEIQYKKSAESTWRDAPSVQGASAFTYILDVQDKELYDVRIRSVNGLNFASPWVEAFNHYVLGKQAAPSNVVAFSGTRSNFGIQFQWSAIADLDLSHYELRWGADWGSGTLIAQVLGTAYFWSYQPSGGYNVFIKAVDSSGNYSATATPLFLDVADPDAPAVTYQISGSSVVFSWPAPASFYAIDSIRILYGDDFATAVDLSTIKGNSFSEFVSWGSLRRFWFITVDIAGNESNPASVDVVVAAPGAVQTLTAQVVDNNVLIDWEEPSTGTLPVDHYNLYDGASFGSATLRGQVAGTFAAIFELVGGNFNYWIAAVDTAGNVGAALSIAATVRQPPDYVLQTDQLVDLSSTTQSNAAFLDGVILAPIDATETFAQHFTDNSWTSMQDAISAGYTYFLQPTNSTGYVEKVIDLGVTIASSIISAMLSSTTIAGTVTVQPTISWSADNVSYTSASAGVTNTLATNFRYIKIRVNFSATDDKGLASLSSVRVMVSAKKEIDSGMGTSNSTDAGGTVVTFNKSFYDVESITVTPKGTSAIICVYDFVDAPNPTSFKVLLFNTAGTRVTADFSWTAQGFV